VCDGGRGGEGEGVRVGVGPMQTWFAVALRQHYLAVWQTDMMTKRQSHKVWDLFSISCKCFNRFRYERHHPGSTLIM